GCTNPPRRRWGAPSSTDSDAPVRIRQRLGRLPGMFDAQQGARRPSAARTRRAVSGVAATVLGSLMLLGCTGGDGEPTPPPPSESTTSAPPSPSPSPPEELPSPSTSPAPDGVDARLVEPDEMKRDDEVGAI